MTFEGIGEEKEKMYCWSDTIRNMGVSLPCTEAASVHAPAKKWGLGFLSGNCWFTRPLPH